MLGQFATMEQAVFTAFSQILSGNNAALGNAEAQLGQLAMQPGYPETLTKIALNQGTSMAERQMAAVNLKNYIDKYWTAATDEFVGPEPSPEAKLFVKQSTLMGIADPNSRIRVLMAAVITKITNADGAELWPELFDSLMGYIKSGNPDNIHGTMRVLSGFVDDISEEQFSHIAPILMPEVYKIFCAETNFPPRIRARAVGILKKFLQTLKSVERGFPEAVSNFLEPLLPQWMAAFQSFLSSFDMSNEQLVLRTNIFKTIEQLVNDFSHQMKPYMNELLPLIWNNVLALQPSYLANYVNPGDEGNEAEDIDSDGNIQDIQAMLFSIFNTFSIASDRKSLKGLFSVDGHASDFMSQLVSSGLLFSQITAGQIDTWESDANQFVQDQDDYSVNFSMRYAIKLLLDQLMGRYKKETLEALTKSAQAHLTDAIRMKAAANENWWKVHESCLYNLGLFSKELMTSVQQGKIAFDFAGLFEHIIQEDLKQNDCPILQSQAVYFSSQFASTMPEPLVSQYINSTISALSPNCALFCRIGALKAMINFCRKSEFYKFIAQSQGPILEYVCNLLPTANESMLVLVLETLCGVLKVDPVSTASFEAILIPMLINVWLRNPEDFVMNNAIMDIFEVLAKNPHMFPFLQNRLLQPLSETLRDMSILSEKPGLYSSAISLVTILLKNSPLPLLPAYTTDIFPAFIHCMVTTDNHNVLEEGQECLKVYIQKDLPGIAQWTNGTKTGLQLTLETIAALLATEDEDSPAYLIGPLINTLIQKGSSLISPILPDLLAAVARRLSTARRPTIIQNLVLVFASVIPTQLDTLLNFLHTLPITTSPPHTNALEVLLNAWCDHYTYFMGFYSLKLSASSLAKLYISGDPRVWNVIVKGQLQVTKEIVTRSKSKKMPHQYTMIPFPAKILSLLLADYQQNQDAKMKGDLAVRGTAVFEDEQTDETVD
ncbi:Importin 9, partial [Chytridiales sp. JEL 0842]